MGDSFTQCQSLVSVTFAANSSLLEIQEMAFYNTDISSIVIPASVTTLGNKVFRNCSLLTSVTIAEGGQLASMGTNGFQSSGLTSFGASQSVLTALGLTVGVNQTVSGSSPVVTVYIYPTPPDPTCFPAGTPVQTDQGEMVIEQLVPGEHTVRGKMIVAITQTRPLQKHVVCFKKDSLCRNVPSQQTLCSKEHKVLYRGEMTKARDLADMCKNVKKVSYNGETLFNVLLEKHGKMLVNNMICETLHPENISAKFAKSKNTSKKNVMLK